MIDFHNHLDLYKNALDLLPVLVEKKVFTLVVTTSPRAWIATSKVFKGYENVRVALGLHPEIVERKVTERDLLISSISEAEYIGEVGLDGSKRFSKSFHIQEAILDSVFYECQQQGGKVISIHSRKAATRVLDLIEKYPDLGIPVLHWFTGSNAELKRALVLGCWFSVGPSMLDSKSGRALISNIPLNRIITETDGPFAGRDGQPFFPWDVNEVIEHLRKIWSFSKNDLESQLNANLTELKQLSGFN